MKKAKRNRLFRIILIAAVLALVLLILFFSFRAYKHYTTLRSHENYFRQPNLEIAPWMTTHFVISRFNIPKEVLFQKLGVNDTRTNQIATIDSICKKNHLNCTEVLGELNSLRIK